MSSYLSHKDLALRILVKQNENTTTNRKEFSEQIKINDTDFNAVIMLLVKAGFIEAGKSSVKITPEGREFISYTSFQNEYDKSFAKELFETAQQNDYGTTRLIAVWAIVISGLTLLLEVLKSLIPSLRS